MKATLFPFIALTIVLAMITLIGCTPDITEEEAKTIAADYIISEIGTPSEPMTISKTFLEDNEWHVQFIVGDDKGTAVLDKKGNFQRLDSYRWD